MASAAITLDSAFVLRSAARQIRVQTVDEHQLVQGRRRCRGRRRPVPWAAEKVSRKKSGPFDVIDFGRDVSAVDGLETCESGDSSML